MTTPIARYRIDVTQKQLDGLKRAITLAQQALEEGIPKIKSNVTFFEQQTDGPDKDRFLPMARENLATAQSNSALVNAAVAPVYGAKLLPALKLRPKAAQS